MFYYGYLFSNPYYLLGTIGIVIASLIAIWAQAKVHSTYSQYKRIPNSRNITGYQVAREILDSEGLYDVEIFESSGELSDHYNPMKKTVNLSRDVYQGTSIAALAVAAHECGHVIQHKEKYIPISLRNMILPIANVGQYLGWIAIMIGILFGRSNIAWFGFVLMCGILLFQLVTLPVEFNASSRALTILQERYLNSDEYVGAKKMLSAAAMTYVAAMISTLMSMFRLFLMVLSSVGHDDRE